jgi:hypothetical protein
MRLTVRYRAYPQSLGTNNRSHFLLAGATLDCRLSFEDGSVGPAPVTTNLVGGEFMIDVGPAQVPDRPAGGGKQLITRIDLDWTATVTLGGLSFTALRILQRLLPTPHGGDAGRSSVAYDLVPGGWTDAAGRVRNLNSAVHPLVDATQLPAAAVLELNTLLLDITPGWGRLHQNNPNYQLLDAVIRGRPVTFKVFAHTAGTPLIWYAIVPNHLRGRMQVSPHIFLQPSDNREGQNLADDQRYLFSNRPYFDTDGGRLMSYLLPPVTDPQVASFGSSVPSAIRRRNVVNFRRATVNGRPTGEMTTDHWNIGAGFQKAFEQASGRGPAQLLLVPQRVGLPSSGASNWYGGAVTRHVTLVGDAVLALLDSNTDLTTSGGDVLLQRDKIVFSGYSESGFDLWNVSTLMPDNIKAVVAIEPQNLNAIQNDYRKNSQEPPPQIGKDVIPILLRRKVKVFIIGRHHTRYHPQVPAPNDIRLLPNNAAAVFRYPPDPTVNDFIKLRVQRMLTPTDDPFLLPDEQAILTELARRGITGAAVMPVVFGPKGNQDTSPPGDGVDRWYSHQFALSGGDEMSLDPAGVYGHDVTYRTWFAVAVQEIG